MSDPTYTTAQVHHRLGVPKPTIRNWSAAYASFLSECAHPGDAKTRRFTDQDLIVLNTVRHLTRVEGLKSNQQIRESLASGHRVIEFPVVPTPDEQKALARIKLVPLVELERVLDRAEILQSRVKQANTKAEMIASQRDRALMALNKQGHEIASLKAVRMQFNGALIGFGAAGIGLGLLILVVVIGMSALQ